MQADGSNLKQTLLSEIEHIDSDSCELTLYHISVFHENQIVEHNERREKKFNPKGYVINKFGFFGDSTLFEGHEETTIDTVDTKIIKTTIRDNRYKDEEITDSQGNIVQNTQWHYDDKLQNWQPYQKEEIEYDKNGNETLYINYISCDSSWCPIETRKAVYNEEGMLVRYSTYNRGINSYICDEKSEITYGDHSSIEFEYSQFLPDTTFQLLRKTERFYNDRNAPLLEVSYKIIHRTQETVNESKTEYIYNDQGLQISYQNYWWRDSVWSIFGSEEIEYEENTNRMKSEALYKYDNGVKEGVYKYEYSYDEQRTIKRVYRDYDSSHPWRLVTCTITDKNDKVLYTATFDEGVIIYKQELTYDEKNRLIRYVRYGTLDYPLHEL
ncbi:MAG: hypothetical protein K6G73_08080 [Marinilabiliaceae bacterium]|nr:hypothetical protein [Marinilabiliaceae bacterium]